jgi:uncharacterized ubiquitin-like protein YukD
MKTNFQVTVQSSDFRGDHATDVEIAISVDSNMTVGELVSKVFESNDIRLFDKLHDTIKIRFCN